MVERNRFSMMLIFLLTLALQFGCSKKAQLEQIGKANLFLVCRYQDGFAIYPIREEKWERNDLLKVLVKVDSFAEIVSLSEEFHFLAGNIEDILGSKDFEDLYPEQAVYLRSLNLRRRGLRFDSEGSLILDD